MASCQDGEEARTAEELEGMLQASPKRTVKYWRGLCLATAVLGVVAVGLGQAGTFARQENRSLLQRITLVHDKIHTIVAAAVAKREFTVKGEFLVNAYEKKGNPPSAMGFDAIMKRGEKGDVEKWVVTLAAITGKGAALKKRVEDIWNFLFDPTKAGPQADNVKQAREAITISQDGDSVTLEVTPRTKSEMQNENDELADSFKDIKPEFTAKLALGRTFQDMQNLEYKSVVWAPGGIEIKFDAVWGSAVFDVAEEIAGSARKPLADMMKIWRLLNASGEMYYTSEDELEEILQRDTPLSNGLPTLCDAMKEVCPKIDPLFDVTDVLAGVQKLVIQALPGGWEVVVNFDNVNLAPVLQHCVSTYNCTKPGRGGR